METIQNEYNTGIHQCSHRKRKYWAGWCSFDRLDTIGWGTVFIWGGLVMLAELTGHASAYPWWNGWSVFFIGTGAIVLTGTLIRRFSQRFRRNSVGGLIPGLIFLGIGINGILASELIWPTILLVVGGVFLLHALSRKK